MSYSTIRKFRIFAKEIAIVYSKNTRLFHLSHYLWKTYFNCKFRNVFINVFVQELQYSFRKISFGFIIFLNQIIEQGLDLHGRLASAGVLPLHHRLKERFAQLKESLGSISRLKRQQSDSIVK